LVAHGAGLAFAGVEQSGLLLDPAAVLQNGYLPARFMLDRLPDEADRIEVLDLASGAEWGAGLAHGNVHIRAQIAFLHVAITGAKVPHDDAQLGNIGLSVVGGTQIRLRYDLHERYPRTIEVDQGHGGVAIMQQFPRVLLKMKPLDAHRHRLAVRHVENDFALPDHGRLVLADLIALRQVGIEVVLAIEHRFQVDPRFQSKAGADGLLDAFLIDDWEHARHRGINQRYLRVGLAAKR